MFSATTPPSFSRHERQRLRDPAGWPESLRRLGRDLRSPRGNGLHARRHGHRREQRPQPGRPELRDERHQRADFNSATLEAYAENNLCRTSTAITLNPVNRRESIREAPAWPRRSRRSTRPAAPGNTPTGGKISLTLCAADQGRRADRAQFDGLERQGELQCDGPERRTYNVYASYKGDPIFGGSSSSKTYTFTVAQAASTATLSTPTGVSPINGVYYVLQGSSTTMTATVTSKQGTPDRQRDLHERIDCRSAPRRSMRVERRPSTRRALQPGLTRCSLARSTTSLRSTAEISTSPPSHQRLRPSRSFRPAR